MCIFLRLFKYSKRVLKKVIPKTIDKRILMVYNRSIFMKVTECVMKAMATRFMNNEPKASFGRQFSCAYIIKGREVAPST